MNIYLQFRRMLHNDKRGTPYQENIKILNVYVLNNRALIYMKQKWIKLKEVDKSVI